MDCALCHVKFGHVLRLMDSHPFGKVCWLGGFLQTCMNPHETLSYFFPQLFKGHHKWAMPKFMYPIHVFFSQLFQVGGLEIAQRGMSQIWIKVK